jgi:hypothetical protein
MKSFSISINRRHFSVFVISFLMIQPASALCVINDSVLPLALFGSQEEKQPTKRGKKYYDPNKACEEEKAKETTSSLWYRGNFHGLDDD